MPVLSTSSSLVVLAALLPIAVAPRHPQPKFGNDGLHPTDIGTRTLASRFSGILRFNINTMD